MAHSRHCRQRAAREVVSALANGPVDSLTGWCIFNK